MKLTSNVTGFAELQKQLTGMSRAVAGPIAAKAIRAGLRAGRDHIVSACPPPIAQSIGYRLARRRSPYMMSGIVGVNVGKPNDTRAHTIWAAALVVGTQPRFRKTKSGKLAATGQILANTAVSAAIDSAGDAILETTKEVLSSELSKFK